MIFFFVTDYFDSHVFKDSSLTSAFASLQDACPADQSLEESQVPPVPKGGESETSEQVSSHKPQPPKSSSPTKSPHHSTHNSSPQPNDGIPTDMSDTTETEPDSKVTCKVFSFFLFERQLYNSFKV